MVWGCACGLGIIVRTFLSLFLHCELSHFAPSVYRYWLPLVGATPLTVLSRSLKLCICFLVWGCACGLDIILRLFFVIFFHIVNLVIFHPLYINSWYLLWAQLLLHYRLLWTFACVFFMVWGCACGLGIIVRTFLSLFLHCELSHFHPQYIDNGYLLWAQLLLQFCLDHLNLCICFMVWGCACGLDIILRLFFVIFFHIVNSVIFHPLYINSWYLLWAQLLLHYRLLWNFACVFFMV